MCDDANHDHHKVILAVFASRHTAGRLTATASQPARVKSRSIPIFVYGIAYTELTAAILYKAYKS